MSTREISLSLTQRSLGNRRALYRSACGIHHRDVPTPISINNLIHS